MKLYLIIALIVAFVSLAGALVLLIKGERTNTKTVIAAILGGLALFMVAFALCIGFFIA